MREPCRLHLGGLLREEDGNGFDGLELVGGGTAALEGVTAFDDNALPPTAVLLGAAL